LGELGRPMVLVLNMIDEACAKGVTVDAPGLAACLGIPVIEAVAPEGRGVADVRESLAAAALPRTARDEGVTHAVWAEQLTARFRRIGACRIGRAQEWLGRAVRQPATGLPILAAVLYLTYLFVGVLGAQQLVGLFEQGLFGRYLNPAATALFAHVPLA